MYMLQEETECSGHEEPVLLQIGESIRWLELLVDGVLLRPEWVLIGAALVLQYHATVFWGETQCGRYGSRSCNSWLRTVGRQLVVLQFYYCPSPWLELTRANKFIWSMGFVVCDVYLMHSFTHILMWLQTGGRMQSAQKTVVSGRKVVRCRYMDFTRPLVGLTVLVFSQVSLFLLFYIATDVDPETHDTCNGVMLQWIVSVAVILESGLQEIGGTYNTEHWVATLEALDTKKASYSRINYWLRRTLDFGINSLFREALLGIAPVLLCVASPMDLIKDVLAIFFICKMDELNDPMSIEEMIERMLKKPSGFREDDADTEELVP